VTLAVDIISTYLILKVHSVYEHTTKACFVISEEAIASSPPEAEHSLKIQDD